MWGRCPRALSGCCSPTAPDEEDDLEPGVPWDQLISGPGFQGLVCKETEETSAGKRCGQGPERVKGVGQGDMEREVSKGLFAGVQRSVDVHAVRLHLAYFSA